VHSDLFTKELDDFRVAASEFSRAHPALAPLLDGSSTDPDVERLLDAMAFGVALVRRKMLCSFPELIHAMTSLTLPHGLRAFPATTVLGFTARSPSGQSALIPRGTQFQSEPVDGTPCIFTTADPVEITPLELVDAVLLEQPSRTGELRLSLSLQGLPLSRWQPGRPLRLYLSGEFVSAAGLHLLLSRHVSRILLSPAEGGAACELPAECLTPVGFAQEDALIPYPPQAYPGYRLLQEYFHAPEKFLFFDLDGWDRWLERGEGTRFTISFHLDRLPFPPPRVRRESFTLHAVLAVNLFPHAAVPISVHHRSERYPLRPEGPNPAHYGIFSVDRVTGYSRATGQERDYIPFERFESEGSSVPSYQVMQAGAQAGVDMELDVCYPGEPPPSNSESLSVTLHCTNASLPEKLRVGDITKPVSSFPDFVTARNITPIRPGQAHSFEPQLLRKLVAHLSLNHRSLQCAENLRALLGWYLAPEGPRGARDAANLKRISGIESMEVAAGGRTVAGIPLQGLEILIRLQPDHFAGKGDLHLFGCVLDHFLGGYVATNCTTRLTVEETTSGEAYIWPVRLGNCNETGLVSRPASADQESTPRHQPLAAKSSLTRQPVPAVASSSLLDEILSQGHQFSYHQVMRSVRRSFGPGGTEHIPGVPWRDRVRVRPELSLGFAKSDVARVERDGSGLKIENSFLRLLDFLPTFYTEDLLDENGSDSSAGRDFLDIFQQRLYLVFWECLKKSKIFHRVAEEKRPADLERLFCLIGLGEKELRDTVPDACQLLRQIPLHTLSTRPALGLQTLLRDELGVHPLYVEQCVQRRVPIPEDQRARLGASCCSLGVDTVLGCEMPDRSGKIRIHIGPLALDEYQRFVPGAPDHATLIRLIRRYLAEPWEFDLQLKLAAGAAKPLRLGAPDVRLGFNSWCFSGPTLGEVSTILPLSTWPAEPTLPASEACPDAQESKPATTLVDHFQREVAKLRDLVARYAEEHPEAASLVNDDPGVERLIEGSAFQIAKLRLKLDDDIPEIIHDLIDATQPNALKPVPATTLIVFSPKPNCRGSRQIPVGTELTSAPVQGTACRFSTGYPVEIHPLSLLDAKFVHAPGKAASIELRLKLSGMRLDEFSLKSLRLFLGGEGAQGFNLYLVLLRYVKRIILSPTQGGESVDLDADHLQAVGFEDSEALFPLAEGILPACGQTMQEYFLQPGKFLFLDLLGWEKWTGRGVGAEFEIRFELDLLPFELHEVSLADFVLFATPAVNVFAQRAKPITLDDVETEYPVVPDGDHTEHFQVYGIGKVTGTLHGTSQDVELRSCQGDHLYQNAPNYQLRRYGSSLHPGFDTFIAVAAPSNIAFRNMNLNIGLLCSNGTLPQLLLPGDICLSTDTSPTFAKFANCKPVTRSESVEGGNNALWRLFSLCNLNLALLTAQSLQAIIKLVARPHASNNSSGQKDLRRIQGIVDLEVLATDRLIEGSMLRGWEIRISLNQEFYDSPGELFLFGALLDDFLRRFVTLSCAMSTIVVVLPEGKKYERPAKLGRRPLL
jgi:type VI secretion system protein ImpG